MITVLINPFEVAPELPEDQFLAGWQRAAEYMRSQPGFVSTKLHRAVSPDAKFRFVNVAECESPGAFQQAVSSEEFRAMAGRGPANYPALYEVAVAIESDAAPSGEEANQ